MGPATPRLRERAPAQARFGPRLGTMLSMEREREGRTTDRSVRRRHVRFVVLAASAALVVTVAVLLALRGGAPAPTRARLLPASPTQLPSADPTTFRRLLAQLKGKPVVVNFWGSWCGPCRQEAPRLAAAAREFSGRVQFLGVDVLETSRTPARAFIREFGWPYPSVFDVPASIEGSLGMSGQPVTVFFDAAGRQVFIRSGAVKDDEIRSELEKILAS
jgi:cytochrome c biogenesis protein CcmG/thiol:disulfide interchange protein DsbE